MTETETKQDRDKTFDLFIANGNKQTLVVKQNSHLHMIVANMYSGPSIVKASYKW